DQPAPRRVVRPRKGDHRTWDRPGGGIAIQRIGRRTQEVLWPSSRGKKCPHLDGVSDNDRHAYTALAQLEAHTFDQRCVPYPHGGKLMGANDDPLIGVDLGVKAVLAPISSAQILDLPGERGGVGHGRLSASSRLNTGWKGSGLVSGTPDRR